MKNLKISVITIIILVLSYIVGDFIFHSNEHVSTVNIFIETVLGLLTLIAFMGVWFAVKTFINEK